MGLNTMRKATRHHVDIAHRGIQEGTEIKQLERKVVMPDKTLLIRKRCYIKEPMTHSRTQDSCRYDTACSSGLGSWEKFSAPLLPTHDSWSGPTQDN